MTTARVPPILVASGFLALYAATRVEVHRFDAVSFMLAAQSDSPGFPPHHLLYTRLAWVVGAETGADRLMVAMQALSSVCAAVGLGLYCWLLQSVLGRASAWWAVIGAALLGLSSSFWISAGESDPYALTLACLIAATVGYRRAVERDALAGHLVAGLAVAAATLVHQLVALYTVAYVVGLAFGRVRRPLACAATFLAAAAAIPAVVYLLVGVGHAGVRDLSGLLHWLTTYAHVGYWGTFRRDNLVDALYGFLYAVAAGAGGLVPSFVVRAVSVPVIVLGGFVIARRLGTALVGPDRALAVFLAAWIVLYLPFIVWWEPSLAVHWQFVLVPLVVIVVWTAAHVAPRSRLALAVMAIVVAFVGGINYVRAVWPLTVADNDRATAFVERALVTLPRDARVVAPIGEATNIIAARLGPGSVFVVPHSRGADAADRETLGALRAFVETASAQGRSVWVFRSLLEPPQGLAPNPRTEVGRLLERFRADGRLLVLPTEILERPMRRHPWDVIGS